MNNMNNILTPSIYPNITPSAPPAELVETSQPANPQPTNPQPANPEIPVLTSKISRTTCQIQHVYPSRQQGAFDIAIARCIIHFQNLGYDIEPINSWHLYYVNHWCLDKEVLVILTNTHLWIIYYNWIRHSVRKYKKISLNEIKQIQIGQIQKKQIKLPIFGQTLESIADKYINYKGKELRKNPFCLKAVRLSTNYPMSYNPININEMNPLSTNVPYFTLKSHIVNEDLQQNTYESAGNETNMTNDVNIIKISDNRCINNFIEVLSSVLTQNNISPSKLSQDIQYNNMTGVTDLIYNGNQLGSYKKRGDFIW